MRKPTVISRRINSCWDHLSKGEHEEALIDFFPALDKTAKLRRPKFSVGARIKEFLADEEGLISSIATDNCFVNCRFSGYTFPEAIYKFGRNAIAHEGELDPRLTFDNKNGMEIGHNWNLPPSYIYALILSVMIAPENTNEFIDQPKSIRIYEKTFPINAVWGSRHLIRDMICEKFRNPYMFNHKV